MLTTSRLTPQFRYDTGASRFRASNGKFVARETVKAASESIGAQAVRNIESDSQRFYNGEISHAEWDAAMRGHIRDLHVSQSALASGGWEQMTPSSWGRSGAAVREQYAYLNGMGERIQSGYYGDDLSHNGFLAHARSYGQAGRQTFEKVQALTDLDEGGEVSNELAGTVEHHCEGPRSCKAMSALGWVSHDDPRWLWPGERLCITQCQCRTKTRKSGAST